MAGLSIGTSGAIRTMTDRPYADPGGRLFCYALTEDHWAVGSAVSNGGSVVRWAGSAIGETESPSDEALLSLADTVAAGSDGLVMLPFLLAERPAVVRARGADREDLVTASSEQHALALCVTEEHCAVSKVGEWNA